MPGRSSSRAAFVVPWGKVAAGAFQAVDNNDPWPGFQGLLEPTLYPSGGGTVARTSPGPYVASRISEWDAVLSKIASITLLLVGQHAST